MYLCVNSTCINKYMTIIIHSCLLSTLLLCFNLVPVVHLFIQCTFRIVTLPLSCLCHSSVFFFGEDNEFFSSAAAAAAAFNRLHSLLCPPSFQCVI